MITRNRTYLLGLLLPLALLVGCSSADKDFTDMPSYTASSEELGKYTMVNLEAIGTIGEVDEEQRPRVSYDLEGEEKKLKINLQHRIDEPDYATLTIPVHFFFKNTADAQRVYIQTDMIVKNKDTLMLRRKDIEFPVDINDNNRGKWYVKAIIGGVKLENSYTGSGTNRRITSNAETQADIGAPFDSDFYINTDKGRVRQVNHIGIVYFRQDGLWSINEDQTSFIARTIRGDEEWDRYRPMIAPMITDWVPVSLSEKPAKEAPEPNFTKTQFVFKPFGALVRIHIKNNLAEDFTGEWLTFGQKTMATHAAESAYTNAMRIIVNDTEPLRVDANNEVDQTSGFVFSDEYNADRLDYHMNIPQGDHAEVVQGDIPNRYQDLGFVPENRNPTSYTIPAGGKHTLVIWVHPRVSEIGGVPIPKDHKAVLRLLYAANGRTDKWGNRVDHQSTYNPKTSNKIPGKTGRWVVDPYITFGTRMIPGDRYKSGYQYSLNVHIDPNSPVTNDTPMN